MNLPLFVTNLFQDVDLLLTPLNPKLFPGTKGLEVHNGFESTQARFYKSIAL